MNQTIKNQSFTKFWTMEEIEGLKHQISKFSKRDVYKEVCQYINGDTHGKICALYGMRDTGKSVILQQLAVEKRGAYTVLTKTNQRKYNKGRDKVADSGFDLDKSSMERLLSLLDKRMSKRKHTKSERFKVVIVGGAVMVLTGERDTSKDIDAIWRERRLSQEIEKVSHETSIGEAWMNKDFTKSPSYTDSIVDNCYLAYKLNCLDVYFVKDELLLCMKFIACRDREGKHDIEDIGNLIDKIQRKGTRVTQAKLVEWYKEFYGYLPKERLNGLAKNLIRDLH